jgi:HEAT repeat protein
VDGIVNFYLPGYQGSGLAARLRRTGSLIRLDFNREETRAIPPDVRVAPELIAAIGRVAGGAPSFEARANAARALGVLRGRAALDELYRALRSKDDTLMYEALIAIQKIGDPSAAGEVAFLLRDLEERIQVAAIETVGLLRGRESLPELARIYNDTQKKNVRRAALNALAMLPDPASRPTLLAAFEDRDSDLRRSAAEGLGRLADSRDRQTIQSAFEGARSTGNKLSLAFAAAAMGNAAYEPGSPLYYVVDALGSRSWRGVAQPFLVELCRREAVRNSLYPSLPQLGDDEKVGVAQALAVSRAADAVRPLEALGKDPDGAVAAEALRALRVLRSSLAP